MSCCTIQELLFISLTGGAYKSWELMRMNTWRYWTQGLQDLYNKWQICAERILDFVTGVGLLVSAMCSHRESKCQTVWKRVCNCAINCETFLKICCIISCWREMVMLELLNGIQAPFILQFRPVIFLMWHVTIFWVLVISVGWFPQTLKWTCSAFSLFPAMCCAVKMTDAQIKHGSVKQWGHCEEK